MLNKLVNLNILNKKTNEQEVVWPFSQKDMTEQYVLVFAYSYFC